MIHIEGDSDCAHVPLTTLHTACFHGRTARLFDKDNFFKPLVAGEDVLHKRHANTHLAQVGQPTPHILASSLLNDSRTVCMPKASGPSRSFKLNTCVKLHFIQCSIGMALRRR